MLVYRGGVMAAVGHNHVIVNRALQGWVRFDGALSGGGFFLTVPVSGFVVDESAARRRRAPNLPRRSPRRPARGRCTTCSARRCSMRKRIRRSPCRASRSSPPRKVRRRKAGRRRCACPSRPRLAPPRALRTGRRAAGAARARHVRRAPDRPRPHSLQRVARRAASRGRAAGEIRSGRGTGLKVRAALRLGARDQQDRRALGRREHRGRPLAAPAPGRTARCRRRPAARAPAAHRRCRTPASATAAAQARTGRCRSSRWCRRRAAARRPTHRDPTKPNFSQNSLA